MSKGFRRATAARCVCGHHRTLHDAVGAGRERGLGACIGQGYMLTATGARRVCPCKRFVTPGQRRLSEYNRRHNEAVRVARAEEMDRQHDRALLFDRLRREQLRDPYRTDSQEGQDAV